MEPTRDSALVDLIDRILVKGVILQADLIITVSGIPLIGVNLKAAMAGMRTMLDYGMMEVWDEKIRKFASENSKEKVPLYKDEEIVIDTFASHWHGDTYPHGVWRLGYLYLTNRRLFLFRKKPAKILFEVPLDKIKGITIEKKKSLKEKEDILLLFLENDESNSDAEMICTVETKELKRTIEKRIQERDRTVKALTSTH